jgi:tetratricopeptide (TPR) repeat protein
MSDSISDVRTMLSNRLFSALSGQSSSMAAISSQALSNGMDKFSSEDYEGAIREFRRSIAMAPRTENSLKAYDFIASAYLKLEDTEKAMKAYSDSIRMHPESDEAHVKLGNLYFQEDRFQEAEREYAKAVKLNPSSNNLYALGQAHLSTGRYQDAEAAYARYIRQNPESGNGYYGIGQAYAKQGRYEKAIDQFEKSIALRSDFYYAHAEMGYAYADLGETEKAQEILSFLEENDASLASTLDSYINKVSAPEITVVSSEDFWYESPRNFPLLGLNSYLATANSSYTFSMEFTFSKSMDRASVENPLNWSITKSTESGAGQSYNYGLPVSENDVSVNRYPVSIVYDQDTQTAKVYFKINQNSYGTGTIDTSHLKFTFTGKDAYGGKMDSDADAFMGVSGIF